MALIKSKNEREIELLEQLEQQIARRDKRQRIFRFVAGAVAILAVAAIATGHAVGYCQGKHHRR